MSNFSLCVYLAAGESKEAILKQYPTLEIQDIDAVLQFGVGKKM